MIGTPDKSMSDVRPEKAQLRAEYSSEAILADALKLEDLGRPAYCVFGVALDNVHLDEVYERMQTATGSRRPLLVATLNVNILIGCLRDEEFREAVLFSDICVADGKWVVWLSRCLGVPIKRQITGCDLLEVINRKRTAADSLGVYFFGAPPGAAKQACSAVNALGGGLRGAGFADPGVVTVDDISRDASIDNINSSGADFLVAALGAKKGQLWLRRNHNRIAAPVRAHLGAVVNFCAGSVKRAPRLWQISGLEWLWRITAEPHLWQRYLSDGMFLARLMLASLPQLAVIALRTRRVADLSSGLMLTESFDSGARVICAEGALTAVNVSESIDAFRAALSGRESIVVDLSKAHIIDARMLGLFLLVEKAARANGLSVTFTNASGLVRSVMSVHGFALPHPYARSERIGACRASPVEAACLAALSNDSNS